MIECGVPVTRVSLDPWLFPHVCVCVCECDAPRSRARSGNG